MTICLSFSSSLNRITLVSSRNRSLHGRLFIERETLNVVAWLLLRYIPGTVVLFEWGQRELITKQDLKQTNKKPNFLAREGNLHCKFYHAVIPLKYAVVALVFHLARSIPVHLQLLLLQEVPIASLWRI